MKFADTIDYKDGLFKISEHFFNQKENSKDLTIESESAKTSIKNVFKKEKKKPVSIEYNYFDNYTSSHLLIMK